MTLEHLSGCRKITNIIHKTVKYINASDGRVLIFLMLSANYLSPLISENEETYLQLARQYMDPDWIVGSRSLTSFSGSRYLFQWVVGSWLQWFSFEATVIVFRLLFAGLFTIVLNRLRITLGLEIFGFLVLLQALYLPHQSVFGGEWIFLGVETKELAYVHVFIALNDLLNDKPARAIAMTAIATYFHVLVGAWFVLVLFIYLLMCVRLPLASLLRYLLAYMAGVSVHMIHLANGIVWTQSGTIVEGINTDWVYSYFRNPHHAGIFLDAKFFMETHAFGVLLSLLWFGTSWYLAVKTHNTILKRLSYLNGIIFGLVLGFTVIAYFDTNGSIVKYYPFRQAALGTLLAIFQIGIYVRYVWQKPPLVVRHADTLMIGIVLILGTYSAGQLRSDYQRFFHQRNNGMLALSSHIRATTDPSDVFLVLDRNRFDGDLRFMRLSERERFVVRKFVPVTSGEIFYWYQRVLAKQDIIADFSQIQNTRKKYRIDYVVSNYEIKDSTLRTPVLVGEYRIYAMN